MIVADTNLLVYLLVEGERTSSAQNVLETDGTWIAPLLWRSEMRNALVQLHRANRLDLPGSLEVASTAEIFMSEREFEMASGPVLQLACESGRSAYDCEFVALAMQQEVPLVTSDQALVEAFPGVAVSPEEFVAG